MTTKNLYLAAMACALAGNAALAQSALPSDTQLEAWDKKFLPGQYRVEEYDVDASGKPLPNTARLKSEAQCISQKEMQAISRGPAMLAFTWKCEPAPEHTSLDDSLFQLALSCGGRWLDLPPCSFPVMRRWSGRLMSRWSSTASIPISRGSWLASVAR